MTEEQKIKCFEDAHIAVAKELLNDLRELGLSLAPDCLIVVKEHSMEIGIKPEEREKRYMSWASDFRIHRERNTKHLYSFDRPLEFAMASSGIFSPKNSYNNIWRIRQCAEFLTNWDRIEKRINLAWEELDTYHAIIRDQKIEK